MNPASEDVVDQALDRRGIHGAILREGGDQRRQDTTQGFDFEHVMDSTPG